MRRLIGVVWRKELKDHLRDRRSVASALAGPLLGPLLFGMMFTLMASWYRKDKPVSLAVVGRENAPGLMAHLERSGVKLVEPPQGYEEEVKAGRLDAVLVVPEAYGKDFEAGRMAAVRLVVDNSRNSARATVRRVQVLLQAYGGLVGAQRLWARGVSPELSRPLRVDEVDLATPERMAATVLSIVPLFLVLSAFLGATNIASDTMAGERERGSLEPLLLQPVPREAVVVGKWLAAVVLSWLSVVVVLAGFTLVSQRVPLQDLGVKARFDVGAVVGMAVAVLPVGFMSAALQMLVATYSRTFKEAQSTLQLLTLLPTLPGTFLALSPVQTQGWMYAVPMLGQELMVLELLRGEQLGVGPYVVGALVCAVLTVGCLGVAARLLRDERIVFGRS